MNLMNDSVGEIISLSGSSITIHSLKCLKLIFHNQTMNKKPIMIIIGFFPIHSKFYFQNEKFLPQIYVIGCQQNRYLAEINNSKFKSILFSSISLFFLNFISKANIIHGSIICLIEQVHKRNTEISS